MPNDSTQRFLFEHLDIRGELVTLTQSYQSVLSKHNYPVLVAQLLGEALAASALLCSTLKFDGLLILQARSEGAVPLIMVECDSQRHIRGIARYHEEQIKDNASFQELMQQGVLALTIDPTQGQRYQGIVPLEGDTLAHCLADYFKNSEQLPTLFIIYADGQQARGLLLQALPSNKSKEEHAQQWQHITTLAQSLTQEELLSLDNATILHRLYHEEDIRIFDEKPITFSCSCSRARSANALISLGKDDALQLLEEQQGRISIDCQFCNEHYSFDAADVTQLFATGTHSPTSDTIH